MSNYNEIKNIIHSFSGNERHITIPKIYLELTGDFNTAALLNQLVFWSDKTKRKDGFFYKSYKEWEEEICLSQYQVSRSIKQLKEMKVVDTKLKKADGAPTIHYYVNMEVLSQSIINKLDNRLSRNLINDNEVSSYSLTVDDTVDDNSRDNTLSSNSTTSIHQPHFKSIIDYLNEKSGKKYKHTTSKTQSVIRARWNENFEEDDFRTVIETKTKEWLNTDMEKYLRPETLFGTKFESYLNQKELESIDEISGLPTGSYDPLADVRDLEI